MTATHTLLPNFTTAKASGELQMVFATSGSHGAGNQYVAVGQVDPEKPLTIGSETADSVTEIFTYAGTDEEFAAAGRRRVALALSQANLVRE